YLVNLIISPIPGGADTNYGVVDGYLASPDSTYSYLPLVAIVVQV
ncbi:unnamed protein product, partial [marine sediment metagenome]